MRFVFYLITIFLLLLVITKADSTAVPSVACQAIASWNYSGNTSLGESQLNDVTTCLENILTNIDNLRKQGYDTGSIEALFDSANSVLIEAKDSYINKNYDSINSKISSVLDSINKISYEIERLNATNAQVSQSASQPTGLAISYSSLLAFVGGAVIIVIAVLLIARSRRKKELRGISKLVKIKSRLE